MSSWTIGFGQTLDAGISIQLDSNLVNIAFNAALEDINLFSGLANYESGLQFFRFPMWFQVLA
jgi:hypothetical protein